MNRLFSISKTVIIIVLAFASVSAWAGQGYISDAAGSVSIAVENQSPRRAVTNDAVTSGTVIRTGNNSHAVVTFEDGQVVSMQANSTFKVREYSYEPGQVANSNIVFSMFKGGMRFITGLVGQRNPKAFRLATPNATIGVDGAEFLVVIAGGDAYSQVISGSIAMTNAAGTTILTAGQTALTSSSSELTSPIFGDSVPAGTFSRIAAIPVSSAVPASVPLVGGSALTERYNEITGTIAKEEGAITSIPPVEGEAAMGGSVVEAATASEMGSAVPGEEASPTTIAAENYNYVAESEEDSDFYAGILFGSANYRYSNITNYGRVGAGVLAGYALNDKFSIEIKYSNLGGFESNRSTLQGSSFGVSGILYYPIDDELSIFGRMGIARTILKETAKPGFTGDFQHFNTGFSFGLGGQYNINQKTGIRAGLDIYPVGDATTRMTTTSLLYMGGVFKF